MRMLPEPARPIPSVHRHKSTGQARHGNARPTRRLPPAPRTPSRRANQTGLSLGTAWVESPRVHPSQNDTSRELGGLDTRTPEITIRFLTIASPSQWTDRRRRLSHASSITSSPWVDSGSLTPPKTVTRCQPNWFCQDCNSWDSCPPPIPCAADRVNVPSSTMRDATMFDDFLHMCQPVRRARVSRRLA